MIVGVRTLPVWRAAGRKGTAKKKRAFGHDSCGDSNKVKTKVSSRRLLLHWAEGAVRWKVSMEGLTHTKGCAKTMDKIANFTGSGYIESSIK